jgi:hypothetical protein
VATSSDDEPEQVVSDVIPNSLAIQSQQMAVGFFSLGERNLGISAKAAPSSSPLDRKLQAVGAAWSQTLCMRSGDLLDLSSGSQASRATPPHANASKSKRGSIAHSPFSFPVFDVYFFLMLTLSLSFYIFLVKCFR